jgi:hypothetical protein
MRTRIISTLTVTLLLAGAARVSAQTLEIQQKVEKDLELKKLQGVWVPKLLVTRRGVEEYPLKGRVLLFQKNHFVRMEGARPVLLGTFGVEPSSVAWQLDLMVIARDPWDFETADAPSPKPKLKFECAYRVAGDLLTVSYDVKGIGRPTDLTAGDGRYVVVYERDTRAEAVQRFDGLALRMQSARHAAYAKSALPEGPVPPPQAELLEQAKQFDRKAKLAARMADRRNRPEWHPAPGLEHECALQGGQQKSHLWRTLAHPLS